MFPSPAARSRFRHALLGGLAVGWLATTPLHAQDRVFLSDSPNHVEQGKIIGLKDGFVQIQVPAGQISYSLVLVRRVEAAPPPTFASGFAAYQAGDWDKALAALKPIADRFKGLPTDWARQTTAALGDIYIEKNDLPKAIAAYNDYKTLYPAVAGSANSLRMNVAEARIAFAQSNFPAAEKQLVTLRDAALRHPADVTNSDGAAYGQACFLLGQIEERQGRYQAALQDYLRTVTLFYQDNAIAARAEKSADALRAAHKEVSVP